MQSEELLEKAVKSAMLSVIKEHPMGHWRDDQVKEVARRAIIEAALSAAEPVAWVDEQELRYLEMVSRNKAWADFQRSVKVGGEKEGRLPLYAQVQDVVAAVIKLGIYGRAYDRAEERRAYTYEHQPGNIEAHKLGRACSDIHSGGDWIDRGLNLLNSLQREGFGVFELPAAPAKQEGGND